MNVSQLQASVAPRVQTTSSDATEKDADFLALRLLNKRARVTLSSQPIDLSAIRGKASLFATANQKAWFAAVVRDQSSKSSLILSPLADLRSAFATAAADDDRIFQPQRRLSLDDAIPVVVAFACNDSRLLVGVSEGAIAVFDTALLFSPGDSPVNPLHTFSGAAGSSLLSVLPNPGDMPELVAVLRECSQNPAAPAVELLDVLKNQSTGGWRGAGSPNTTPASLSWSPKGKQLALGLQSGDIVTFSPSATSTPKSIIPRPPGATDQSVISNTWLTSSSFHAIYAPQGALAPDTEQSHFNVSLDSKSNSASDVKLTSPYLPFPGLRPPGAFIITMRNWDPAKFLLFAGDSSSSDIGVIGNITDASGETWCNLSLEETSTPSLPLDKDMNDTILIGLELDLTNTSPFHHTTASGEGLDLPPPPILYAYASDGTIIGWNVLNVNSTPYPGVAAPASTIATEPSSEMTDAPPVVTPPAAEQPSPSPFGQATAFGQKPSVFGQQSAFATQASPAFGQSAFGQPSSRFGQQPSSAFSAQPSNAPSFGQSAFGQPAFGQSAFGSTAPSTSPFGQSAASAFGSGGSTSAFSSAPSSGGFGAFSSSGPTKFGQSGFGFGSSPSPTTTPPVPTPAPDPAPASAEDSMAADDAPSFGGLSLGMGAPDNAQTKLGGIFGNTSTPFAAAPAASESGSLIKPATGFGAFGGTDQKSAFGSATKSESAFGKSDFQVNPDSGFGKSTFGTQPSPAFGQSTFGQPSSSAQPAFGKSGFGQSGFAQAGASAFGKPSIGATSPTPATTAAGGGFGAFASSSPTTFGSALSQTTTPTKPVWATSGPEQPKPVFSGSVFGQSSDSPAGKAPAVEAPVSAFAPRETPALRDESRSPSPVAAIKEEPPATPLFKSSAPAPTTGAFGQLKSSPSAFYKPASGFGVGGDSSSSSPFFNPPKKVEEKPVSAFALSSTPPTTPLKSTTGTPAFGASSMPGTAVKTSFGAPSTPQSAFAVAAPTTGAFSAFAGTGGFGAAAAGGTKSFSDLLRGGGDDAKDPSKSRASVFKITTEDESKAAATPNSPPQTPTRESAVPLQSSTTPEAKAETVLSPNLNLPEDTEKTPTTPAPRLVNEEADGGKGKGKEQEEELGPRAELSETPSFASVSSASTDSFVEVSAKDDDEDAEEGEVEDDTKSFVSELSSDSEPSEDELPDERDSEEETQDERRLEPTNVPLPSTPAESTRSPSTTPKADPPTITLSTSPPPPPQPFSFGQRVSPTREVSTTPPGSPAKESPRALSPAPTPGPSPKTPLPANSPFGLLPRPSTRPARSSPLASAPLSREPEAVEPNLVPPTSKSAPPATTPQPALPKPLFGQWTPPVKAEPEPDASRPKTPPLLFGAPSSGAKVSGIASMPSLSPSSTPPPVKPPAASMPSLSPATTPHSFGFAPSTPSLTQSPSPQSTLFGGGRFKAAEVVPPPAFTPPPFTPPPMPPGGLLGSGIKKPAEVAPVSAPVPQVLPAPPMQPPKPEEGMQAECLYLFASLGKELQNLKAFADIAGKRTIELAKPSGFTHTALDLCNPPKWAHGDIKTYGRVMAELQEDIRALKQQRVLLRRLLREMGSHMLKAGTKKEEIIRFNRAKTDAEFAKMLKVRTLGPEYLETQMQLRRDIRAMRDRVQKLEDHLQASKKRVNALKTGKPGLRAPSLDTINRTFRNIDIAIKHQSEDVSRLRHRLTKLDISDATRGDKDKRLFAAPDSISTAVSKRPTNVTQNVAATTAAALNAERSAQKLKRVLLAVRREPLLNTGASKTHTSVPTLFHTPQKAGTVKMEPATPPSLFGSMQATPNKLFGAVPSVTPPGFFGAMPATTAISFPSTMPLPAWSPTPSELEESPSHSPSRHRERTGSGAKHHQKPIALKKAVVPGVQTSPSPAPAFDWGPVPVITPMKTLSADVRRGK
ncbi:hypothetical protein BV22DRAFT_1075323 [Leucogyrophana mollusca]|uniref:Uncharacterized protein n=1 Tax=Leucogyrophana mollusca TaxID=85980 RepID=A0ACB8B2P7_9AGAM|nr:hypothetical protein BV22DRAFT_1075323 [Leucogyrophana mollusca]